MGFGVAMPSLRVPKGAPKFKVPSLKLRGAMPHLPRVSTVGVQRLPHDQPTKLGGLMSRLRTSGL